VLEQLARVAPITSRQMFGGVGVYSEGYFFALLDDDTTYFKVDDGNRPDFLTAGMGPFMPGGDPSQVMQYYELPAELLDDAEALAPWMTKAIDVARRARTRRRR
jgi:DNA transformation protein and related proteins